MEIRINEYYEPDHFKAINEDNYNISRTCEYEKDEMHHIHNSCEILFVEEGSADYYISGKKYHIEKHDILIIGAMEHHRRRIDELPFSRYGFTIRPSYYRSLMLGEDLERVLSTPSTDDFVKHYKNVEESIFQSVISMLHLLKSEETHPGAFRSYAERAIITHLIITLFRAFGCKRNDSPLTAANERMLEIKEYIDTQ